MQVYFSGDGTCNVIHALSMSKVQIQVFESTANILCVLLSKKNVPYQVRRQLHFEFSRFRISKLSRLAVYFAFCQITGATILLHPKALMLDPGGSEEKLKIEWTKTIIRKNRSFIKISNEYDNQNGWRKSWKHLPEKNEIRIQTSAL